MIRVTKALLLTYALGVVIAAFLGAGDVAPNAAADEADPTYIGAPDCKKCHLKQFKSWGKSKLASAFDALKPDQCVDKKKASKLDPKKDYTKDATCLKCHTTAYGKASGYPEVVADKAWTDEEKERAGKLEGVQCEACHGPGSKYSVIKKENKEYKRSEIVAAGAVSPPTAEQCAPCHAKECPTMGDDYKFDFEKVKDSELVHEHKELKYDHDDK